jgi:hypothetical protein
MSLLFTIAERLHITLVVDYGIVDIAGFRNRKNIINRVDNIGDTLVSLEKPIYTTLHSPRRNGVIPAVITFRDTLKLLPAGYQSLQKAAEAVGVHKLELPKNFDKSDMKRLLELDTNAFIAYAAQDVVATLAVWEETGAESNAVTLGSIAANQVRANIMKANGYEDIADFDTNFRGLVRERITAGTKISSRKVIDPAYAAPWGLATEAFFGGRNESYSFGVITDDGKIFNDFDLSSAYPLAMTLIPDIDFNEAPIVMTPGILERGGISFRDMAFMIIDFSFPEDTKFPCIPIRDSGGGGLIYPLSGKRIPASAPEVYLALEMGAMVNVVQGFKMPIKENRFSIRDAIKSMVALRKTFKKGTMRELMQKTINNSVYGKMGQGLRGKRAWDTRGEKYKDVPPSPITQPFYAAQITALIRASLGAALDGLSRTTDAIIISATTDGILCSATQEEIDALDGLGIPGGKILSTMRKEALEHFGSKALWEIKHEVEVSISMRTRGQLGVTEDVTTKPLVARAGYKPAEGEDLVETYLTREGFLVSNMVRLPAVVEYSRNKADAQAIPQQRRVLWEYDYKRALNFETATQRRIKIDGKVIDHVGIKSSRPWVDFDDYRLGRRALLQSSVQVIKSVEDAINASKRLAGFRAARASGRNIGEGDEGLRRLWATSILRGIRHGRLKANWLEDPNSRGAGVEVLSRVSTALDVTLTTNDWKNAARKNAQTMVIDGAEDILNALEIVYAVLFSVYNLQSV